MQEDLKPCPFCGSEAVINKTRVRIKNYGEKKISSKRSKKNFYTIGCSDPECILTARGGRVSLLFTVSPEGREYMIRRWNRRIHDAEQ